MKKSNLFLTIPCFFLLLAGCARGIDDPPRPDDDPIMEWSPEALAILDMYASERFDITEEEAADKAGKAMQTFYGDSPTRSGAGSLTVKNIKPLASPNLSATLARTRADGTDAALPENICYAVNFSDGATDSAGFVLVAADKRIGQELLAVVPAGSFPAPGEEVDHDGLAFFLENLEEYAAWSIAESERKADSLQQAIAADLQAQYPDEKVEIVFQNNVTRLPELQTGPFETLSYSIPISDPIVERKVDPLIPVEWDQGVPFNDLVKDKTTCGNAVTGCVITATAQLMAYWKKPAIVGTEVMDWSFLCKFTGDQSWSDRAHKPNNKWLDPTSNNTEARYQTAYLMKHIGESIGASYDCDKAGCPHCNGDGTMAASGDARTYLDHFKYKTCNSADYDFEKVVTALQAGKPIYMDGYSTKRIHNILGIEYPTYHNGHAWLLDGFLIIKQKYRHYTTIWRNGIVIRDYSTESYTTRRFIHNNWGWDGDHNGYYASGVFNYREKQYLSDATPLTRGEANNYQYKIRLWYNIYCYL